MNNHLEERYNKVRSIFEKIASRVDALKIGEKVTASGLAESLAPEFGITAQKIAPIINFILDDYPGLELRMGKNGGRFKV